MNYEEAVYLGSIVGAVLFFAAGYLFHASRTTSRPGASAASANEQGVDELVQELQREQQARRQCEDTIQQLQAMIGQMQMNG
jgi:hypothetical protein